MSEKNLRLMTAGELRDEVVRLRHLLKSQMLTGEELEVEAIVTREGMALVNLRWDKLSAQMPVAEVRALALDMLRVCEWADMDAKVLRVLRERGMGDSDIGGFMAMMRESRGGSREHAGEARRG